MNVRGIQWEDFRVADCLSAVEKSMRKFELQLGQLEVVFLAHPMLA